jgi:hypothetical protein
MLNVRPSVNFLSINTESRTFYLPQMENAPRNIESFSLPKSVDHIANHDPERLFAVVALGSSLQWRDISFRDLIRAVKYTGCWIQRNVRVPARTEYLAYIGSNDIRYAAILLACMKTNYKVQKNPRRRCRDRYH